MNRPSAPPSLRILAVTPVYWPCVGGSERLLATILEHLVARGHDAEVLASDAATQPDMFVSAGVGLPREESRRGVKIHRVAPGGGFRGKAVRFLSRQRGGRRLLRTICGHWEGEWTSMPCPLALDSALRTRSADVVIAVNWWSAFCLRGITLARRRSIPVVALPLLHVARPWAGRPVLREAAPSCACAVGLTPSEAEHLRALGAPRTAVIGCGIDPGWGSSADGKTVRVRHGIGNRPVVGFVGRQDEGKGTPTLIAAMRRVWQRRPDAVLLLAGPSAHRDAATCSALGGLPAAERAKVVEIADFSDADAPHVFAACDLLAQPSVEESFGLVLIEAWKAGRPVIGADIPATRDLVDAGGNGLIVPPSDPEALSEAIVRLVDSPDDRLRMGTRGQAEVLARYTVPSMIEAWESVLREAAGRARDVPDVDPAFRRSC